MMNKLEPLHEQAINLFVSGKRQHEIASALDINPRTLRRWSESELFMNELNRQHDQAMNLERDARARAIRQRHETHRLAMEQLAALLRDPQTPIELRVQCLRIAIQDQHNEIRQNDTVAFRDRVYQDKLAEKKQKEEEKRKAHEDMLKHMASLKAATNVMAMANDAQLRKERFERRMAELDQLEAQQNAEKAAQKAAKSGHSPMKTPPATPTVQPVKPFRYPPVEKKADKTGHSLTAVAGQ